MGRLICLMLILSSFHFGCRSTDKSKENVHQKLEDSVAKIERPHKDKVEETATNLDSIKKLIRQKSINDTSSFTFILEGNFSAEGNEGKAFYRGNKINKIEITFYGETGKSFYSYKFVNKMISVSQQHFNYRTDFTEVKSDKDIMKGEQVNFSTDLSGRLVDGNHGGADLETFHELKKVVPFDLF